MTAVNTNFIPPIPPTHDIAALMNLIELLSDPAATKKRLKDFADAAENARQAIEGAAQDRAAVLELKFAAQSELSAARQEHEQRIETELEQHQKTMQQEREQIEAAKSRVAKLEQAAAEASAKAKAQQEKIDRRLRAMESA